jgi:RHS repeat-associated protein
VWRAAYTFSGQQQVAATIQSTHYYPSGLPWHTNTGVGADVQNRKYNGKEFVEMHGLDEYDSEARWYYPAIMRTTTMDPLAEKYYDISPYAWCGNNPINSIDPDGREPITLSVLAVKGLIGAGIDISTQMTANMTLKDQSFGQAFRNIDWTSAGGSFVVGAVGIPGVTAISKTAKVATIATSVAVDAAVDVSIAEGNQNIFNGEKSLTTASIDAVGSLVGGKASDDIVKRAKNSISNDISSGTFSTLNKTEKNTLRQTQTVVNSQGFEAGTKAVVGLGTETGKQGAKGIVGSGNPSGNTAPLMQNYTQPSDNTRVVRPIYPLPEFK